VGYADEVEDAGEAEGKFSPSQPRVPAGSSGGGRWTSDGGAGGPALPTPLANQQRVQVAELVANPVDANRVLSDAESVVRLPIQDTGTPAQLAQNAPDAARTTEATAADTYRRLFDRAANSRDSGPVLSAQDITRVDIALTAEDYVGSTRWSYNTLDPRTLLMGYPVGTNKCSLFVAQVLGWNSAGPGFPNHGQHFDHPPNAGQWADPNFSIKGWAVLGQDAKPEAGDVAAQGARFSDAFGHVMIVGTDGTLIGTVDGRDVSPQGVVAKIPLKENIVPVGQRTGPIMFRRFIGN